MDSATQQKLIRFQVDELSAHQIYTYLAKLEKNPDNKQVLEEIAAAEIRHYRLLSQYSGKSPHANTWKVWFYIFCARFLGLTFAFKLLESEEHTGASNYSNLSDFPDLMAAAEEEEKHEDQLISLINEEKLSYMGSVVLGLNDALVEFTGALAGYTLALNDTRLIALTGGITGIAAALSMGSSEYLSTKSDKKDPKNPVTAAIYTSFAYLVTVASLIAPFMFFKNVFLALGVMLVLALLIIALFNYYNSVICSESFKKRFGEMALLSFSVAGLSFLIGYLLKLFIKIDV